MITGGAGFIGSHVVRLFTSKYPDYRVINLDNLTYAGNLENLADIGKLPNYQFVKGCITDQNKLRQIFDKYQITNVIHLAAESHVDKSIQDPLVFINTNVVGTANLLLCARNQWQNNFDQKLFFHISTDEVYGSLPLGNSLFTEKTAYDPRSPYSASKASSDHLVRSWFHTYNLPIVISNCSNNYGPNQFPEKLIPLFISNILKNKQLPVYGQGLNIRDWLFVIDHARAIDQIFHHGKHGETYNIGGNNEWKNIELVELLCDMIDYKIKRPYGRSKNLIAFVEDRAGHDLRYAIDNSKITSDIGWKPKYTFEEGLSITIDWYLSNSTWLQNVISGKYKDNNKMITN